MSSETCSDSDVLANNVLVLRAQSSDAREAMRADLSDLDLGPEVIDWIWLGTKLAEGAIAWIGGKVLESLFGSFPNANAKLQEVLRAELQGEALRKALAAMESLTIRLSQYHNAGDIDRLKLANVDAENLVAELKSLSLLGFHSYHQAVDLELLILEDLFKATNVPGEKQNMKDAIDRAIDYLRVTAEQQWIAWVRGRFGDIWFMALNPGSPNTLYQGGHRFDGNPVRTVDFAQLAEIRDKCTQKRTEALNALMNQVYKDQILPSREIRSKWSRLKASLG